MVVRSTVTKNRTNRTPRMWFVVSARCLRVYNDNNYTYSSSWNSHDDYGRRTGLDDVKNNNYHNAADSHIVVISFSNLSMDYVTHLEYHLCRRRAASGTTPPLDYSYCSTRIVFVFFFMARKQYDVFSMTSSSPCDFEAIYTRI